MSANKGLIRIQLVSVGGRVCLDLRRCLSTPSGDLIPTSRGFSLPPDLIADFIERVLSASETKAQYIEL